MGPGEDIYLPLDAKRKVGPTRSSPKDQNQVVPKMNLGSCFEAQLQPAPRAGAGRIELENRALKETVAIYNTFVDEAIGYLDFDPEAKADSAEGKPEPGR